uniref:Uncharacterized protein n=1 Tax=Fundulus heteroclitus TaxID=8078 RepID=A0A3Q2QXP8_FUNHE
TNLRCSCASFWSQTTEHCTIVKHDGGSIMPWACLANKGPYKLHIVGGIMKTSINQKMDALNRDTTGSFNRMMIKQANIKLLEWPQPQPHWKFMNYA